MNDLQIITNSITPAKVEFNYKEIEARLDIILDQYEGLIFTEDTVTDCKKTIAELRKEQKSLDDFRKNIKKKLTESVTLFENDCKVLYKKFDDVIQPLKIQADYYEEQRRENKRIEVQGIIDNLVETFELTEKYSKGLTLKDGYLIASISIKKVTEELEHQANLLKDEQDEEELNRDFITNIVNQCNEDTDLSLLPDTYTRLLEYMDIREVINRINEDTKELTRIKEEEKAKIEKEEAERLALEEKAEAERLAKEEEDKMLEELEDIEVSGVKEYIEEIPLSVNDFEELPTAPQNIEKVYKITGTEENHRDLEIFLNAIVKQWGVI